MFITFFLQTFFSPCLCSLFFLSLSLSSFLSSELFCVILVWFPFLIFFPPFFSICTVPPMMMIQNQLVGAAIGQNVTLECTSEAFPKSINFWMRASSRNDSIITTGKLKLSIFIWWIFLALRHRYTEKIGSQTNFGSGLVCFFFVANTNQVNVNSTWLKLIVFSLTT